MEITNNIVARLTPAQFGAFKRGVNALLKVGIAFEVAVEMVLEARRLRIANTIRREYSR